MSRGFAVILLLSVHAYCAALDLPLRGGCLCRGVTYSISVEPSYVYFCHCTMCRRMSGAPSMVWLTVPISAFELNNSDRLTTHKSSERFQRKFCSTCGTHILFARSQKPSFFEVTYGSLDNPEALQPQNHIWNSSRLPWFDWGEHLPTWPGEVE
mmetsp:Transcript_40992/g.97299  ORF Transcript_40992/g.97299 Transcript_40992/m.97299 type:complete len:154 (-) Transcript_40992:42-503(-)